jgi:hypothetical protein
MKPNKLLKALKQIQSAVYSPLLSEKTVGACLHGIRRVANKAIKDGEVKKEKT